MRNLRIVLMALSVGLNVAFAVAWAVHAVPEYVCRKDEAAAEGECCPLTRELSLTDEQRREIEPRFAEFRSAMKGVCRQNARRQRELIDLLAAASPDEAAIRARTDEIAAGQRNVLELVVAHLRENKKHLTPDQQKALFERVRGQGGCAGQGGCGN